MKKRWHVFNSCDHILFINVTLWTKCWTYSSKVQRNYVKLYCDYFTIKASIHIYIIFRYILSRAFIVKGPEVTVSAAEWERGCIINTQHHNTHTKPPGDQPTFHIAQERYHSLTRRKSKKRWNGKQILLSFLPWSWADFLRVTLNHLKTRGLIVFKMLKCI